MGCTCGGEDESVIIHCEISNVSMHLEPIFCKRGDEMFHKLVSCNHAVQLLQQVTVLITSMSINAVASETGVFSTASTWPTNDIRQESLEAIVESGVWCGQLGACEEWVRVAICDK